MIYHNGTKFVPHTLNASFLENGKRRNVATSDRKYWEQMVGKWGHLDALSFSPISLDTEQQSRLDEINAIEWEGIEIFTAEVEQYVSHNAVAEDVEAPFLQDKSNTETNSNFEKLVKEQIKDEVRFIRWQKEVSGTSVNGMSLRTDANSQQRVGNLVTNILSDEDATYFDFESENGVWIEVNREMAIAIGKAVSQHVQACFTRCKELHQEIDSTPLDSLHEVDIESGWPE